VVASDDTPRDGASPPTTSVSLLDARHRLLAGSATFTGVRLVVAGAGGLAVLLSGGRLVAFQEVELAAQVGWHC